MKGIAEMETILELCRQANVSAPIDLDLTLARGLNYYTGAILEVKALDVEIGSISGGGRYDNLTSVFGWEGVSGVGVSFGADRIYDVLYQLQLFPEISAEQTKILFVVFGEKELKFSLQWAKALRKENINTEVYAEPSKLKKQLGYADNKRIPFVAIVGENEMQEGKVTFKNMSTGEQQMISLDELIRRLKA